MDISPSLIWFLAGVVFLAAEFIVPGCILIFFMAGCWITGLAVQVIDIGMTTQIIIFTVSSLALLFSLRKYSLKTFKGTTLDNDDDSNADPKIGKTAIVTKEISTGIPGEIKAMGSFWRAVADTDIAIGQSVIIEHKESEDGLTFKVKIL
jgi:membrane protein implicated in regulation of membrane protease activity